MVFLFGKDYQLCVGWDYLVFVLAQSGDFFVFEINSIKYILLFIWGEVKLLVELFQCGVLLFIQYVGKGYWFYYLFVCNDGMFWLCCILMWLLVVFLFIVILLALIFKEVIVFLFVGVWVGVFIVGGMCIEFFYYILLSFFDVVECYVIQALADSGYLVIIVFFLLIGGMVAIIF